jgi:pseudouridine-5'-phosphate glycosidase
VAEFSVPTGVGGVHRGAEGVDARKESDHLTAFTDAFATVATRENTPREVIRKW